MNIPNKKIRILIVDDSSAYRDLLVTILESAPDMQVVGTARDGLEGIQLAERLKPDLITMDIHMPNLDGFEATRQIMSTQPCPIVMISASIDKSERNLSFEALQAGALSIVDKPSLFAPPNVLEALISQVRSMSEVKVVRRWRQLSKNWQEAKAETLPVIRRAVRAAKINIVGIASSTGGPKLLAAILADIPENFPVPIVIVQHITIGFGVGLAEWLNQKSPLQVRIATPGEKPQQGQVLIAPDDYHMTINSLGALSTNKKPPIHGLRPAADYLFKSLAQEYGAGAVGVVLTGMGNDGAAGLLAMRETGAHTIAQDEATSVVFGMPAAAIEMGGAEQVVPGPKIASALKILCGMTRD